MTESMDPYLYPGTDVRRNLREIRDSGILAQFEAEATIIELNHAPLTGLFDIARLKAIHKFIFQDVARGQDNFGPLTFRRAAISSAPPVSSSRLCTMSFESCRARATLWEQIQIHSPSALVSFSAKSTRPIRFARGMAVAPLDAEARSHKKAKRQPS